MITKARGKVAAFLDAQRNKPQRCAVCDHKAASKALDEIIAARRAGQSKVSVPEVHKFLVEEFKVPYSASMVHLCCRMHRGGGWRSHGA